MAITAFVHLSTCNQNVKVFQLLGCVWFLSMVSYNEPPCLRSHAVRSFMAFLKSLVESPYKAVMRNCWEVTSASHGASWKLQSRMIKMNWLIVQFCQEIWDGFRQTQKKAWIIEKSADLKPPEYQFNSPTPWYLWLSPLCCRWVSSGVTVLLKRYTHI